LPTNDCFSVGHVIRFRAGEIALAARRSPQPSALHAQLPLGKLRYDRQTAAAAADAAAAARQDGARSRPGGRPGGRRRLRVPNEHYRTARPPSPYVNSFSREPRENLH